jgi:hypothetical protein
VTRSSRIIGEIARPNVPSRQNSTYNRELSGTILDYGTKDRGIERLVIESDIPVGGQRLALTEDSWLVPKLATSDLGISNDPTWRLWNTTITYHHAKFAEHYRYIILASMNRLKTGLCSTTLLLDSLGCPILEYISWSLSSSPFAAQT